jgi:acetyl-CoA acetyltransferase
LIDSMASSSAGIIGYGHSVYEKVPSRSEFGYFAEAARSALASAGVKKEEIDGLATSSTTLQPDNAVTTAEHFGLGISWAQVSTAGGAGAVVCVMNAIEAVETGKATHVLCLSGAAQDMRYFKSRTGNFTGPIGDYLAPHGFGGMNGLFGIVQRKHMERYGTTREQLGRIAVHQRANAKDNEQALLRDPMTIDDYLNARIIADPLRLYDCVLPCSGAEAILVGPLDRVPEAKQVRLLAGAEQHNYPVGEVSPIRGGWEVFRDRMYAKAGVGPGEFAFMQAYDDYPIMVALQIEDMGLCRKGEVGPFLAANTMTYDGSFPLNTGGAQLSCGQSGGGGGMIILTEAVRQLRREAVKRQVRNPKYGLVTGYGMVGYGHGLSASAMILEGGA